MEIFIVLWNQYLYIPLYNFLIWLYSSYSSYNLGVAVIILTILLRLLLLPFTILVERGKIIGEGLEQAVREIQRDFQNDPVKQRHFIRRYLKRNKVRPWAKAVVLGVQGLVLVLLYQVFIGGINTQEKIPLLYSWMPRPDFINTQFFWFDVGPRNYFLAAIVAGYVFAEILIGQWEEKVKPTRQEELFALLFPAMTFLVLAWLPSVKSLFILTSLLFSTIISMVTALIKKGLKKPQKQPNVS